MPGYASGRAALCRVQLRLRDEEGAGEIRAGQVGPSQVGTDEVGRTQISFAQVGADEQCSAQAGPTEIRSP